VYGFVSLDTVVSTVYSIGIFLRVGHYYSEKHHRIVFLTEPKAITHRLDAADALGAMGLDCHPR
jgi:hypothetical protein